MNAQPASIRLRLVLSAAWLVLLTGCDKSINDEIRASALKDPRRSANTSDVRMILQKIAPLPEEPSGWPFATFLITNTLDRPAALSCGGGWPRVHYNVEIWTASGWKAEAVCSYGVAVDQVSPHQSTTLSVPQWPSNIMRVGIWYSNAQSKEWEHNWSDPIPAANLLARSPVTLRPERVAQ